MSTERQLQHVERQLREAVAAGAKLLTGGERLPRDGYWLTPAVVTDVTDTMDLMQAETFGPVVCIQAVDSLDEAIAKANDTRYGLAATLWIGDAARGEALATRIEAGLVGVNRSFGGGGAPWAGAKESGLGHTGGVSGARHFLHPRSVTVIA
jgi:acyl-CoA reductase-like NAD-dependent aldehyde dehydrogenase